ncbi:FAD binding domain-containing protein [Streptomyces sp. BK340]|nr:FAD binding domain-containing protein [Streptomyces sp. BK340]
MVYAQTEVCKDLIALQLKEGGPLLFEAEALAVEGAESERPRVRFRCEGDEGVLECDYVVGCDGFWGVARKAVPASLSREFERT